jgi:aromatic amino acid aminotransferase I
MLGFGNAGSKERTTDITIPKYPTEFGQVNLATSLQYGAATGIVQLQAIFNEFSAKVFQPAYADWTTKVHTGNTDAWTRCVLTLMNEGDSFLTEEWTYPSAVASAKPYGIHPISVPIDAYGMRIGELRKILANWDESARGLKR